MANIKRMEPLTEWLDYPLVTTMLEPPLLRLRLRPVDALSMAEGIRADARIGRIVSDNAIAAVAAWDLTDNGVPIPVTEDNKAMYLRPLLAEEVEGRGLLGLAILEDAQDRKLFLKN